MPLGRSSLWPTSSTISFLVRHRCLRNKNLKSIHRCSAAQCYRLTYVSEDARPCVVCLGQQYIMCAKIAVVIAHNASHTVVRCTSCASTRERMLQQHEFLMVKLHLTVSAAAGFVDPKDEQLPGQLGSLLQ